MLEILIFLSLVALIAFAMATAAAMVFIIAFAFGLVVNAEPKDRRDEPL